MIFPELPFAELAVWLPAVTSEPAVLVMLPALPLPVLVVWSPVLMLAGAITSILPESPSSVRDCILRVVTLLPARTSILPAPVLPMESRLPAAMLLPLIVIFPLGPVPDWVVIEFVVTLLLSLVTVMSPLSVLP